MFAELLKNREMQKKATASQIAKYTKYSKKARTAVRKIHRTKCLGSAYVTHVMKD